MEIQNLSKPTLALVYKKKKNHCKMHKAEQIFLTFSFRCFMVPGLIFILNQFIFVHAVR